MKKAWHIALKDIQILLKDRASVIYLFLLPIVFILVLSAALGGLLGENQDSLIALPVVNLDPGGELSQALMDGIDEAGGVQVGQYEQAEAQARLEEFEIERVLTIPAGFTADVIAGR
jgi:ABC-2 type transport system permease protein